MRRHRTGIIGLLVFITVAIFAACQKPNHQESERYIFVAANISLPYWQEAKAGFMDAALGIGVKADFTGPDSYSPEEELEAFKKAVSKHPAGILIAPTRPDTFKDEIDAAVKAGIPVVTMDSDAPDSRRVLFIGTDNYQAGVESGKRMAEILHGRGNVVVIYISGQLNLEERLRGVQEVFKKYPNIKILPVLNDMGNTGLATDQTRALLDAKQKFDGILCLEASGGPGAAAALYQVNLIGKIPIVAMDKNPETLD